MDSPGLSSSQAQTRNTFSFKWSKAGTYASRQVRDELRRWLLEKYFDGDEKGPQSFLGPSRLRILDAGCGAGLSAQLLFGKILSQHDYIGVDISEAVSQARGNFEALGIPGTFIQADLQDLPEELGSFDLIFSEGVLHHTDGVEASIKHLVSRLSPNGRLAFYVYARKSLIREFTDDMIRESIADMADEEAWDALIPLTRLGKALGDLNVAVDISEDIPLLGIERGSYDLQRLFFYKICKTYYRPDYSLDEMNHVNFDWFRPLNCHRHTPNEVSDMCVRAGLKVERLLSEPSGITVIARLEGPEHI